MTGHSLSASLDALAIRSTSMEMDPAEGQITSSSETDALARTVESASVSPNHLPSVPATSDAVILLSLTGTTHTSTRALLSTHSSFFATLFSLPPPLASTNEAEPIPLPSASPEGLSLILAVLDSLDANGKFSPAAYKYWMKITTDDLVVFAEAAICADAYDIPVFDTAFVKPILARLDHQPILEFAFSAVTKVHSHLGHIARKTLAQSSCHRPEIPYAINSILRQYAPDQHARLEALYGRYPSARHNLRQELKRSSVPNEEDDFSRRCEGKCSSYDHQKKWKLLKAGAAEAVYEHLMKDLADPLNCKWSIRQVVANAVSCGVCATRLSSAFVRPIQDFLEVCESY